MELDAATRIVRVTWHRPLALTPTVLDLPFTVVKTAMMGICEVENQLELQAEAAHVDH